MNNQPINLHDESFIKKASKSNDGVYIHGDTMYITGTRINAQDIDADLRDMSGNIKSSYRYKTALSHLLKNKSVNKLAGYSMGASVSNELAAYPHIKQVRLYNSPSITKQNDHKKIVFWNKYDPIQGIFRNEITNKMRVYQGTKHGHTMSGYQMIYD